MDWPKCEYPGCVNGRIEHRMGGFQICPACSGTGERELSIDEAANIIWDCGWRIDQVYKTEDGRRWVSVEEIWGYNAHLSEDGETLIAAFNAAARAVYERKEVGG